MVEPDHAMHELQTLRRAQGPALRQHLVIDVFQAQAGDLAEDVQRIEDFLQIDQADLPSLARGRPVLRIDHRFQRHGRGAMASAGVEIDKINFLHYCFIPVSCGCYTRGLKR